MPSVVSMPELVRPNKVEGRKHWIEWTIDEQPSQIHFVVKYFSDAVDLGNRIVRLSDGSIKDAGAPDAQAAWAAAIALAANPAKTSEDLVALLASLAWGRTILRQAYGL